VFDGPGGVRLEGADAVTAVRDRIAASSWELKAPIQASKAERLSDI